MTFKSLLLAIDGSQESLYASETAWQLAKLSNASLVAQTVIDSQAIWEFLGKDLPGLIGSGPYFSAHEVIQKSLKEISETLLMSYEARASAFGIKGQCILDEGNIVREILKRAGEHELVIMGHRDNSVHQGDKERRHFRRYSQSEQVAYYCLRPVLLVQKPVQSWTSARLVVSPKSYSNQSLKNFLELTSSLSVAREVVCIGPETGFDDVVADMQNTVAGLPHVSLIKWGASEIVESWHLAIDVKAETLLAISTQDSFSGRTTGNNIPIESFIHYLNLPALLVLPSGNGIVGAQVEAN